MSENAKIIQYAPEHLPDFRDINYQWLEEFFTIEPYDRLVLEDPQRHIIDQGGFIYMALLDGEVVGTCALIKHTEKKYELAKMGVTKEYRSQGIGRKLVETAIDKSRAVEATTLVLATSKLLPAANHLYRKMGFADAALSVIGPLPYKRETIVMAMKL